MKVKYHCKCGAKFSGEMPPVLYDRLKAMHTGEGHGEVTPRVAAKARRDAEIEFQRAAESDGVTFPWE
jgi:hypothetical protein